MAQRVAAVGLNQIDRNFLNGGDFFAKKAEIRPGLTLGLPLLTRDNGVSQSYPLPDSLWVLPTVTFSR